jgi:hypothetical protein
VPLWLTIRMIYVSLVLSPPFFPLHRDLSNSIHPASKSKIIICFWNCYQQRLTQNFITLSLNTLGFPGLWPPRFLPSLPTLSCAAHNGHWTVHFLFVVLGFELRASCLLDRITTWNQLLEAFPRALFCCSYFSYRVSSFCSGLALVLDLPIYCLLCS